jgi:hypothetical protein
VVLQGVAEAHDAEDFLGGFRLGVLACSMAAASRGRRIRRRFMRVKERRRRFDMTQPPLFNAATTMQRQRFLFAALGLLTLWRWALLPTLELAPDEALAVFRVKHGHWGGFPEMGPLVPLFVRMGMLIGGAGEFGVRFFAPLLALAASLAVWRLMRACLTRRSPDGRW